jgi:hypothetical protein
MRNDKRVSHSEQLWQKKYSGYKNLRCSPKSQHDGVPFLLSNRVAGGDGNKRDFFLDCTSGLGVFGVSLLIADAFLLFPTMAIALHIIDI